MPAFASRGRIGVEDECPATTLAVAEVAGLLAEQGMSTKRCLSMVDVGDDGDVAEVHASISGVRAGAASLRYMAIAKRT